MLPSVAASAADTKLSVLSSMSATRGSFFASTRREKSGGIVRTPFTRPFRRSVIAWPGIGVVDRVDRVRADATADASSRTCTAGTP